MESLGPCPYGWAYSQAIPNSNEEIRCIKSHDKTPEGGKLQHVSVSVGVVGILGASRKATPEEVSLVAHCFFVHRGMKYQIEPSEGTNPYVQHLWEVK